MNTVIDNLKALVEDYLDEYEGYDEIDFIDFAVIQTHGGNGTRLLDDLLLGVAGGSTGLIDFYQKRIDALKKVQVTSVRDSFEPILVWRDPVKRKMFRQAMSTLRIANALEMRGLSIQIEWHGTRGLEPNNDCSTQPNHWCVSLWPVEDPDYGAFEGEAAELGEAFMKAVAAWDNAPIVEVIERAKTSEELDS